MINEINGTDFEVIQFRGSGAAEFWCGAATYIERRKGQSESTRIFLKRPHGASLTAAGRNGVVFSTSDSGLPDVEETLTVTVRKPGASLKSSQARRYCRDAFTRSTK